MKWIWANNLVYTKKYGCKWKEEEIKKWYSHKKKKNISHQLSSKWFNKNRNTAHTQAVQLKIKSWSYDQINLRPFTT